MAIQQFIEKWMWAELAGLMAILITVFVPQLMWFVVIFTPLTIFYATVEHFPRAVGFLVAKRVWFVLSAVVLIGISGVVYALAAPNAATGPSYNLENGMDLLNAPTVSSVDGVFLILGFILGALLRRALGMVVYNTLLESQNLGAKVMGISIWGTIIIVSPHGIHTNAMSFYICGIVIGMVAHKAFRIWLTRRAAAYRRLRNIESSRPPNSKGTQTEHEARQLLRQLRLKKLRRRLGEWRNEDKFSKELALMSASLYRIQGKCLESIDVVNSAIGGQSNPDEDTHLLLMKAINLADLNKEEDSSELLDRVLDSPLGKKCPLAHATKALHLADNFLRPGTANEYSLHALRYARKSLFLRRNLVSERLAMRKNVKDKTTADYLTRYLDYAYPVTPTFILDVLGYSLLAGGFLYEARIMFEHCITIDPTYTSAYLHYGDYFRLRSRSEINSSDQAEDLRHAHICYWTAYYSESNRESRIANQAYNARTYK